MIVGIVLAAGRSLRMGRPKPFLEIGGETFLDRAISSLARGGCDTVTVVVGPEDHPVAGRIARAARSAGARVCVNPAAESEQLDSLRAALRERPDGTSAIVVAPVDVPISGPGAVLSIIRRFRESGASLVVPTFEGRRGHPVLIGGKLFQGLLSEDLPEGVRSLIRSNEPDLAEAPVDDPAVLLDVDTPWDYDQLLERET